ncbi:MAG: Rv2175c family DNA-binding protein [Sciscionella sp.]
MSAIPFADDVLDAEQEVLTFREAAERLGLPVSRVQQLCRDRHLVALRRAGEPVLPAAFIDGDDLVKALGGTVTVLSDSGFTTTEMLRWLFTEDDSLPGTPIDALRGNRGREVKRRAQALAL